MAYIGRIPAASALTSADITDGIIVNVDVASDAAINDEKIAPPLYSTYSALPTASANHGRFAHVHADETDSSDFNAYFAHGSTWVRLAKEADVQPLDTGLTSISALTTAADKMIYTTASDTYAVADLTVAGRALLDDATASDQRTTLGLGTAATTAATAYATSTQGTKADNAAALANDQTFTGANRGTETANTDASFDMNVTNNFKCTLTGTTNRTITFTNLTAGQSGNIYFDNSDNNTRVISKHGDVLMPAADLLAINNIGVYWLSYYSDGSKVLVTASAALT